MTLSSLDVAKAAGLRPGKRAGSEVLFTCPRHDDSHPSLSINTAKNVWICGPCGKGGSAWELAAFIHGVSPEDKKAVAGWLRERGLFNDNGIRSEEFVCAYVYEDENRNPLFRVERYKIPGSKTFKQSRADGKGGWIGGKGCMNGVRLVPYRLSAWIHKPAVPSREAPHARCKKVARRQGDGES